MSSPLKTNTETIQNLINQINALPEAETGGGSDGSTIQDISSKFSYSVEDDMYEPGSKLYAINFDNNIDFSRVISLELNVAYDQYSDSSQTTSSQNGSAYIFKTSTNDDFILFNNILLYTGFFNIENNTLKFIGNIVYKSENYTTTGVTYKAITLCD